MTQWAEHDGYMCQACLPIIQVTAKSTAVNNSWAASLVLNNFLGRSGKGCIHTVYTVRLPHLVTSLPKRRTSGGGGVNEILSSGDFTTIIDNPHIVPDMNERVSGNDSFGQFWMKGGERQLPW